MMYFAYARSTGQPPRSQPSRSSPTKLSHRSNVSQLSSTASKRQSLGVRPFLKEELMASSERYQSPHQTFAGGSSSVRELQYLFFLYRQCQCSHLHTGSNNSKTEPVRVVLQFSSPFPMVCLAIDVHRLEWTQKRAARRAPTAPASFLSLVSH